MRGREVQRAFQDRRQAEVHQLQQRVETLESTIEGMSKEFLDFGDRLVRDPKTAEVLDDLRQATGRFLKLARKAADPEDESSSTTVVDEANSTWPKFIAPVAVPFDFNALFLTAIPNLNIPTTSGRFSPRLGFGLPNFPSPSIPTPWDNPWLSYLVAGPSSFASRLYMSTIDLIIRSLRGEVAIPEFIPSVLRYRFRHQNPDSLMRTLARQLQRMSLYGHSGAETGTMDSEIPPVALTPNTAGAVFSSGDILQRQEGEEAIPRYQDAEPLMMFNPTSYANINEALNNLLVEIIKDITLEGGAPGEWLDPWSVQEHIRQEWGLILNSKIVRPTAETLSVLRGHRIIHTEQEMDVHVQPVQSTMSYRQAREWPSLDYGDDFNATLTTMPPNYPIPSFPFYSDPLVAQRHTFSKSTAPPAPPSHFLTTLDSLPPPTHLNHKQFFIPTPQPPQPPLARSSYSRNFVDTYGSTSRTDSTFSAIGPPKISSSATTRPSSPSHLAFTPQAGNQINLPEVLPVTPLVTSLVLQSICFGEGPRFRKLAVDEAVRNFLEGHSFIVGL